VDNVGKLPRRRDNNRIGGSRKFHYNRNKTTTFMEEIFKSIIIEHFPTREVLFVSRGRISRDFFYISVTQMGTFDNY
jgi:hypothetical protein